uniref:Uncharacterized protein n=1 Tax=Panagrolaimus davidi TaxID=227884 RepID=A0A914PG39_9BILA
MSPALTLTSDIWPPAAYTFVAIFGVFNLLISHRMLPDTKGTDLCQVRLKLHRNNNDEMHLAPSSTSTTIVGLISDENE